MAGEEMPHMQHLFAYSNTDVDEASRRANEGMYLGSPTTSRLSIPPLDRHGLGMTASLTSSPVHKSPGSIDTPPLTSITTSHQARRDIEQISYATNEKATRRSDTGGSSRGVVSTPLQSAPANPQTGRAQQEANETTQRAINGSNNAIKEGVVETHAHVAGNIDIDRFLDTLHEPAVNRGEGETMDGVTADGVAMGGVTMDGFTMEEATMKGVTMDGVTMVGAAMGRAMKPIETGGPQEGTDLRLKIPVNGNGLGNAVWTPGGGHVPVQVVPACDDGGPSLTTTTLLSKPVSTASIHAYIKPDLHPGSWGGNMFSNDSGGLASPTPMSAQAAGGQTSNILTNGYLDLPSLMAGYSHPLRPAEWGSMNGSGQTLEQPGTSLRQDSRPLNLGAGQPQEFEPLGAHVVRLEALLRGALMELDTLKRALSGR